MLHRDVKGQDFDRSPGNSVRCPGGGANVSTEDPKKLQLQASERRRCFFSTILGDSNETT